MFTKLVVPHVGTMLPNWLLMIAEEHVSLAVKILFVFRGQISENERTPKTMYILSSTNN